MTHCMSPILNVCCMLEIFAILLCYYFVTPFAVLAGGCCFVALVWRPSANGSSRRNGKWHRGDPA